MDALHLCIALTPLAIYLLFVALMNRGKQPRVMSGIRDASAVALGIMGLAIAGPLELFLPESAAFRFGPYAWLMMVVLYALGAALTILSMRPRLVIYNTTAEELQPKLAEVVQEMDAQSRWAGNGIAMPESGVHMHMDTSPSMRNVQLVASGNEQDYGSWTRLEYRLRSALSETRGQARNPNAGLFFFLAIMLLMIVGRAVIQDHETMVDSLREMLRIQATTEEARNDRSVFLASRDDHDHGDDHGQQNKHDGSHHQYSRKTDTTAHHLLLVAVKPLSDFLG